MSDKTPGQAAYEAWRVGDPAIMERVLKWGSLRDSDRDRWDKIAQAAIECAAEEKLDREGTAH